MTGGSVASSSLPRAGQIPARLAGQNRQPFSLGTRRSVLARGRVISPTPASICARNRCISSML